MGRVSVSQSGTTATGIPIPAPQFFRALRFITDFNAQGQPAYLLGEVSDTGWWYYYPVVLAFKTPLAFVLLLGYGLPDVPGTTGGEYVQLVSPLIFVVGISFGRLFLVRSISEYAMFCLCTAVWRSWLAKRRHPAGGSKESPGWGMLVAAVLLGWLIWTGAGATSGLSGLF